LKVLVVDPKTADKMRSNQKVVEVARKLEPLAKEWEI
jgi:hypothetical protein